MPFAQFDRSQLKILPLNERIHDVDLDKTLLAVDGEIPSFSHPALPVLAEAVVEARRKYNATVRL